MAEHLSISNSERAGTGGAAMLEGPRRARVVEADVGVAPPARLAQFPWAFAIALLIIAGVEAWLHISGWPQQAPWESGENEYYALVTELNQQGSAEVAIVGSSRARESIYVPA